MLSSLSIIVVDCSVQPLSPKRQEDVCADFVFNISQDCLSYLDFYFSVSGAASFITNVCQGGCGEEIYNYHVRCDNVTGENNAAFVDFLCASPPSYCVNAVQAIQAFQVTINQQCTFLTSLPGTDCGFSCSSAINNQVNALGCCMYTYYGLSYGTVFANFLFSSCSADIAVCDGGFSEETIPLPAETGSDGGGGQSYDNFCPSVPVDGIPLECRNYIQIQAIEQYAFMDPDGFVSSFCVEECAKPLYDYFKECDEVSTNSTAPYLDLLCTSNPAGTECARIISSEFVGNTLEGVCSTAKDSNVCPMGCSAALQEINDDFGCCFFSRISILEGTAEANEILREKCSVAVPGPCERGGLSGEVITGDGSVATMIQMSTFVFFVSLVVGTLC